VRTTAFAANSIIGWARTLRMVLQKMASLRNRVCTARGLIEAVSGKHCAGTLLIPLTERG
jgi:hypothetical protein